MKCRQTGVAIVEFALVAIVFLTILLAITDFGRILFMWNAATEATRKGARLAVVCNVGNAKVLAEMQKFLPVTSANVTITWFNAAGDANTCDSTNCVGVEVKINDIEFKPLTPFFWSAASTGSGIGFSTLALPGFSTYLPREIMGQDPQSNTVCN